MGDKSKLYAAEKIDHEAFGSFHERFFRQKDSLESAKAFYSPAYYDLEEKKTAVTEQLYRWMREWTAAHPSPPPRALRAGRRPCLL